jgi:hypothetical protein
MRLFDTDGISIGAPFAVNADTTSERLASVASAPNGDFVVAWTGSGVGIGDDTSNSAVIGQLFIADGTPIGDHFQVNDYTTSLQWIPDVAMGPEGEFVVSWQNAFGSYGNNTDQASVNANRFGGPDVIFATGMDDGTLEGWSGVEPPLP